MVCHWRDSWPVPGEYRELLAVSLAALATPNLAAPAIRGQATQCRQPMSDDGSGCRPTGTPTGRYDEGARARCSHLYRLARTGNWTGRHPVFGQRFLSASDSATACSAARVKPLGRIGVPASLRTRASICATALGRHPDPRKRIVSFSFGCPCLARSVFPILVPVGHDKARSASDALSFEASGRCGYRQAR